MLLPPARHTLMCCWSFCKATLVKYALHSPVNSKATCACASLAAILSLLMLLVLMSLVCHHLQQSPQEDLRDMHSQPITCPAPGCTFACTRAARLARHMMRHHQNWVDLMAETLTEEAPTEAPPPLPASLPNEMPAWGAASSIPASNTGGQQTSSAGTEKNMTEGPLFYRCPVTLGAGPNSEQGGAVGVSGAAERHNVMVMGPEAMQQHLVGAKRLA